MIRLTATCLALALGLSATSARAALIDLEYWAFNLDGGVFEPGDALPGPIDVTAFSFVTGLGTISMTVFGAGPHFAGLFVDHDIDEPTNSFFNEHGTAVNPPAPGDLSWEVDEPGFVFGDIFDNFLVNSLDNLDNQADPADDISMAMMFDFTLAADQIAEIEFVLGTDMPGGFHLAHSDPASNETIYFSGSRAVRTISLVPEPGTTLLLALGLAGLGAARRRARNERRVGIPYTGTRAPSGR